MYHKLSFSRSPSPAQAQRGNLVCMSFLCLCYSSINTSRQAPPLAGANDCAHILGPEVILGTRAMS